MNSLQHIFCRMQVFCDPARRAVSLVATLAISLSACVAQPEPTLVAAVYRADYGAARQSMKDKIARSSEPLTSRTPKNPSRDYALDRMRLGLLTLADGYAPQIGSAWDDLYQILRRAGINKDAGLASVVINEDLKVWKGEPFEQALAFHYIGLHYAMQGSWDNARAAELNSLFPLKAVIKTPDNRRISNVEVIQKTPDGEEAFNHPEEVRTNFALGFLMTGIAAHEIGKETGDPDRIQEAEENFRSAIAIRPDLRQVIDVIRSEQYNTILVVDYGRGPQKVASGLDNSISTFEPITPSSSARLWVGTELSRATYPLAADLNEMATDHRWNNLEDMRRGKAVVGTGLLVGGAGATMIGADQRSPELALAGLGAMAAGALLKAGAHADTRHIELLPQRVYVVPVMITRETTAVTVQVEGEPASRLVLTGLSPPTGKAAQLRYVRLLYNPWAGRQSGGVAPIWATSGRIFYGNDAAPSVGVQLPWILGGDSVRIPSAKALDDYQRAGFLLGMTPGELESLYRDEGITWTTQDEYGTPGLHILEGGHSLVSPYSGTTGYARLFDMDHGAYQPKSPRVIALRQQIDNQRRALPPKTIGQ